MHNTVTCSVSGLRYAFVCNSEQLQRGMRLQHDNSQHHLLLHRDSILCHTSGEQSAVT